MLVIYLRSYLKGFLQISFYDSYFHQFSGKYFDISKFPKEKLEELKNYALKLSEDFPNFIRVDLYIFHDQIYFSELTFDCQNGKPFMENSTVIKEAVRSWKRIDY